MKETRAEPFRALDPTGRRQALIALNRAPELSRDSLCRLALCLDGWLGSAEPSARLAPQVGVRPETLDGARRVLEKAEASAREELRRAASEGARLVTLADGDYPLPLLHLELPPPVLTLRGALRDRAGVAIVGPRRPDAYGLEVARWFSSALASRGVEIVSGFAQGIDIAAHRAALATCGGRTVAVLGCGLGVPYPARHAAELERISRAGAVVSEFPVGTPPRPHHFPIRNRIIAALAAATLVVQASERSGTLITAACALELGRDVFAVPGPVLDPLYRGSNRLLRDGALLGESPEDLLSRLPIEPGQLRPEALAATAAASPTSTPKGLAGRLLELLSSAHRCYVDELAALTQSPVPAVQAALLELELSGLVRRHAGPTYTRMPCGPSRQDATLPDRKQRRE